METNETIKTKTDWIRVKVSFGFSISVDAIRKALRLIPITIFAFIIIKFWIMPRFWELWAVQGEEITIIHILKNMWFPTAALSVINLIIFEIIKKFMTLSEKEAERLIIFYLQLLALLSVVFFLAIIFDSFVLSDPKDPDDHFYVGLLFCAPVLTTIITWSMFFRRDFKKN